MKNMSSVLEPLEKVTGEKDKKKEINWSADLEECYERSRLVLKNIEPLYLPKRTDKLAITLDWSKLGLAWCYTVCHNEGSKTCGSIL